MTKQEMKFYAQKSRVTSHDIIHDYEALCIRSYNLADEMQLPLSFLGPSQRDTGYTEITIKKLRILLDMIDEYIQTAKRPGI